jgi:hypothetical protein
MDWLVWCIASGWLTPIRHEQLTHVREFVWQQTVESIFQLESAVPNWFRLTRAIALAAAARAMHG